MFTRDPLLPQCKYTSKERNDFSLADVPSVLLEIGLRVVPALIIVSFFVNPFSAKGKDRAAEEDTHRQEQAKKIDKQQEVKRKFKSVKAEFCPVKADMVRQLEMEMQQKGISNSRAILDKRREVR